MIKIKLVSNKTRKMIGMTLLAVSLSTTLIAGCSSSATTDTETSSEATTDTDTTTDATTDTDTTTEATTGETPPALPEGETGSSSGGFNEASGSEVESTGVTLVDGTTKTIDGEEITATNEDESTVKVTNAGTATITNATLNKASGEMTVEEASDFFGANAGVLADSGSTLTIENTTITTSATGGNAIFSTGENTVVTVKDTTITTTGDHSRGLDATYTGTINADNVDITTAGAHCAALATDRGEGTVTVTNSKLQTAGDGSPLLYSTGDITAENCTGTSTGSLIMAIEGKNSIHISNCDFVGYAYGRAVNEGIDIAGVMIYQSMSGDASDGIGEFSAADSTLTISDKSTVYDTAPMFFSTNTDAVINLDNVTLSYGSGIILNAAGNDGEWGEAGSNGADVTFNASNQVLDGDITLDDISSIILNLTEGSKLTGAVNGDNTKGTMTVNLDKASTWTVTGTSYVSVITDTDESLANIVDNGNTIYYDSSNDGNAWLNGETVTLSGGGSLVPVE